MKSVRIVLDVCVADEYEMEQLDADTAFLNSELSDQVFMEIPSGIKIKTTGEHVCLLNKAIYGSRQAASAWNRAIHGVFVSNRFKSCGADQCVYVKLAKSGHIYVYLCRRYDNCCQDPRGIT